MKDWRILGGQGSKLGSSVEMQSHGEQKGNWGRWRKEAVGMQRALEEEKQRSG